MSGIEKSQITINVKGLPSGVNVAYDCIHRDNLTFPHKLFDSRTQLVDHGLFNSFIPLIVIRQNSSNTYTIIDGCKRYAYYKQHGKVIFPCQIIITSLTASETGLLRIALNSKRKLDIREKYWIVLWLKDNFPLKEYRTMGMKFGIGKKEIDMLLELSSCTGVVSEAFLDNSLDLNLINYFTVLSKPDQICFVEVFRSLRLSFQIQREFFEWLPEIACKNNEAVRDILMSSNIMTIIKNNEINVPQKINKIRSLLFDYKYPKLSQALNNWKKLASELNPDPSSITFYPDLYFEKDRLEITVSISDKEKAMNNFKKLSNISSEQWAQLLLPL